MATDIEFVDEFFEDLDKINGKNSDEWKTSLFLRMGSYFEDLSDYKWQGTWNIDGLLHLSSNAWSASWRENLEVTLWYCHDARTGKRVMLLAEHPKTLGGQTGRAIALQRAESQLQLPSTKFRDRSSYGS